MGRPNRPADVGAAEPADRPQVTALARGLEVLRCFGGARTELGASEIARLTGLPQPTVWRLCQTLLRAGFLAHAVSGEKFRLGLGSLSLGYAAMAGVDVGAMALERMGRLADRFQAACSLSARDRTDMLIVRRSNAIAAVLTVNLQTGSRLPIATSSSGWAWLAGAAPARKAEAMRALARRHGADWPRLAAHVETAMACHDRHGYVLNNGVYDPNINSVAVPIELATGEVLSLNLGGPASLISVQQLQQTVAPELLKLAETVRTSMSLEGQRSARART